MNNSIDPFSSTLGFDKMKPVALSLMKQIVDICDEFNINYFIISGTLLGYIRHNDFIPWDDDIDLIVDSSILKKLDKIYNKYGDVINFINYKKFVVKCCFQNGDLLNNRVYDVYMFGKNDKYTWPFIDLFIYYENIENDTISFFKRNWIRSRFFPQTKVLFNDINVNIPNDPHYFLTINYNSDKYMTTFVSKTWDHRNEEQIKHVVTIKY